MLTRQARKLADAINAGHTVRYIGEGHDEFAHVDSIVWENEEYWVFALADGRELLDDAVNAEDFIVPWHPFHHATAIGKLPAETSPT